MWIMGENLSKVLKYKHISESTEEIVKYIKSRKDGEEKSLKTR